MKPRFLTQAFSMLANAGYRVTPADRAIGLWDVEGIGTDLTSNQLLDVAAQHGFHRLPMSVKINPNSP